MGRLDGKVALLTGGASGLSKATGDLMAAEGATVVLSDIQEVEGENVAAAIREAGGACSFKPHDTTVEAQWERICAEIMEEHGHLDILLNGAGIGGSGVELIEMELETWKRCLSINLDGVFLGCKHGIRVDYQYFVNPRLCGHS
jgi:NAD(P)-dependent dehydrogenase (short-subunit alcohol dehydrogenase family)